MGGDCYRERISCNAQSQPQGSDEGRGSEGHPSDVMKANPSTGGSVLNTYSIQDATGQYGDKCITDSMMCSGSEDFGGIFEDRT